MAEAKKFWITKRDVKKFTPQDIKDQVANGANVNVKDHENVTPLMVVACHAKDGLLVQALIDAGADVNAKDEYGYTALMLTKEIEVVKALLNAGARVDIKDKRNKGTPLLYILNKKGKADVIQLLIDAGSDLNAVNWENSTPLTIAIDKKLSPDIIQQLLDAGADIHYKKGTQDSPIECALSAPASTKVFKVLLEAGAEITKEYIERNDFSNATAEKLFEKYLPETTTKAKTKTTGAKKPKSWLSKKSAKTITLEELQKYIDQGVDVNATIDDNVTVLMDLLDNHNGKNLLEIIKALLKAGATLNNFSKSFGYTEIMYAISRVRDMEIVQFLIDSGADVNLSGERGHIPLTLLNFSGVSNGSKKFKKKQKLCTEYAKALFKAGANPNPALIWKDPFSSYSRNITLLNDLSFANSGMPMETFQVILDAGAKINIEDGESPALTSSINTAVSINLDLCKLLLNSGAKPEYQFFRNLRSHLDSGRSTKECAEIRECLAKNNIRDKTA